MTNSSSLSKLWLMLGATALAVLAGGGLGLLAGWSGRIGAPILAVAALGALGGAALWLRRTEHALQAIADTCAAAAAGNLEARLLQAPPSGLLGQTQRSVNAMLDITDAFVREATGSMQYFSRGLFFRRVLDRGLPGSFGRAAKALNAAMAANEVKQKDFVTFAHQNVGAVANKVSDAAAKLHTMAEDMSATSGTLAAEAGAATAATEAGLANVQTIAAAAEELSVSVAEISRQVTHSAIMAQGAVQATEEASATVGNLAEAAQKVGEVLRLINAIASRTNLLALNATIEAARAGEFRQRLCGGGERSEVARPPDRAIHRRDRRAGDGDPHDHRAGGEGHRRHRRGDRRGRQHRSGDRRRGRATGRGDAGDRPQHPGGSRGYQGDRRQRRHGNVRLRRGGGDGAGGARGIIRAGERRGTPARGGDRVPEAAGQFVERLPAAAFQRLSQ